jgi:hypothetical protein
MIYVVALENQIATQITSWAVLLLLTNSAADSSNADMNL